MEEVEYLHGIRIPDEVGEGVGEGCKTQRLPFDQYMHYMDSSGRRAGQHT